MKKLIDGWIDIIKKYDYNKKTLLTIMNNFEGDKLSYKLMKYADHLSAIKDIQIDKIFDKKYLTDEYNI